MVYLTQQAENKVCEQTIGPDALSGRYYRCGCPAKFVGAENACGHTRPYFLCGIHRRQYDMWYKKQGSDLRCKPIEA